MHAAGLVIKRRSDSAYLYEGGIFGPDPKRARKFISERFANIAIEEVIANRSVVENVSEDDWRQYFNDKKNEYEHTSRY